MKKTLTALVAAIFMLATLFCLAACGSVPAEGLWENATYRTDCSVGSGEKTVGVAVEVGDYSVLFTVKTDEKMLDKALLEHGLIAGEETEYGLTVVTVNGIDAVWETDSAYWAVYIGETYATAGVSFIEIEDGAQYKFVWEKM